MIIIFIVSSQPKADIPDLGIWDLPVKKSAHLIGYALLGVVMLRGVRGDAPCTRSHRVWAFALTVLYAMTDEYHQTFVPGR
ncbi:MAG: VanZ family protein, partial [Chloroflexota bacterium]